MTAGEHTEATGLVRYDAMCQAIAACHTVDEVKDIRDKARALEVYAQQALNTDAERKAAEIRIRAERKAGELLREMKENGTRIKPTDNLRRGPKSERPTTEKLNIADLGITRDQSSQWQRLAAIPEKEFEEEISKPGPKPSTEGMVNARLAKDLPKPQMDPDALWLWGRLKEFERLFGRDAREIKTCMTDFMREDAERIAPKLCAWLEGLI